MSLIPFDVILINASQVFWEPALGRMLQIDNY